MSESNTTTSKTSKPAKTSSTSSRSTRSTSSSTSALPYRFEIVDLKYLITDAYQRPLTTFVDKIEKNFDPALVGTVCLSERSKREYAVIDGQTRAEGMRRIGITSVPAIVYENLTRQQEAALFSKFQTERRGMTSSSLFKARVIAGNETAAAINEIVEACGFRVDQNIKSSADNINNAIAGTAALEFAYKGTRTKASTTEDPELLRDTLEVIRGAWPKLPENAKSATMIKGIAWFLARNPSDNEPREQRSQEIDMDRLVTKLAKVTPSDLARRADALREGRGMTGKSPAYLAEAIDASYRRR